MEIPLLYLSFPVNFKGIKVEILVSGMSYVHMALLKYTQANIILCLWKIFFNLSSINFTNKVIPKDPGAG